MTVVTNIPRPHPSGRARRQPSNDSAAMVDDLLRMVSAAELPSLPAVAGVLERGLGAAVTLLDQQDAVVCASALSALSGTAREAIALSGTAREAIALSGAAREAMALSGTAREATALSGAAREVVRRVRRDPGRVSTAIGPDGRVIHAVACGEVGETAGVLLAVRDKGFSQEAERDLRRAAQLLAVIRIRQEAVLRAHTEVRAELLTELLSLRRPLPPSTRALAGARRLRLDRPHVVVAISVAAGGPRLETTVGDLAQNLGGVGGRYADTLVAVVPASDPRAAANEISARLRRLAIKATVCAADPVDPAGGELAESFDTARHGLRLLPALGHPATTATVGELALYRLLFDADRAGEVRSFLDAVLRPLLDYDREHRTDLVTTVQVFLAAGGNATQAARELYIHLNTMAKRLDRVARLLGDDWQSGPGNLRLRLALHLHSLREKA